MVINFSYSMSHLRGNVYSKEKTRKNESIKAYENLNNDLKKIYNEFEIMSKYLKNASGINSKNNDLKHKTINTIKNNNENKIKKNNKSNNINNNNTNNINNNIINNNKKEEIKNKENINIYNSNNIYKEINSPIKEENSLEITNEEKMNIEQIKKNLNEYKVEIT